jgi:hypothetical protein
MNIPEMNHQQKRTQKAAPVQRWQRMANFFDCVRKWLMPKQLSILLWQTIERELPYLQVLTGLEAPKSGTWSRKEELGHLIDSATNNHIRFVLAATDGEFRGQGYAQDKWVETHGYRDMEWRGLVDLWYHYNALLAHLAERIPEEHLNNRCVIGWNVLTLGFVIEDYVIHMQHHLDHILAREQISAYPRVPDAV